MGLFQAFVSQTRKPEGVPLDDDDAGEEIGD